MNLTVWEKYGKSIVAFLYAIIAVVLPLFTGDHHIDASEGIIIALAIGNNLIVFIVPLSKAFGGVKSVVNALLAALAVAQVVIVNGSDWSDPNNLMMIVSAFLVAIGVTLAPAASVRAGVQVTAGSDAPVAL